VLPSHGRSVVRYRHVLDEALGLDAAQLAVLAVLELRGPQTVAELRARTERMAKIDSVDHELGLLASREEPLAARMARRPGQKEVRWVSLLSAQLPGDLGGGVPGAREPATAEVGPPSSVLGEARVAPTDVLRAEVEGLRHDIGAVRAEVETLRAELDALRTGLDDLRASLGG
jgi:uncharacterized protein YceH (UPF0502 family)